MFKGKLAQSNLLKAYQYLCWQKTSDLFMFQFWNKLISKKLKIFCFVY